MSETFEHVASGPNDHTGETSAPSSSLFAALRAKRDQILTRTLDLPVPGYDGAIFVRYKPITQELSTRANERFEKSRKQPHLGWESNALMLAGSVVGVYALDEDGKPVLVEDAFGERVAEGFGEKATRALDVVKIVYVNDMAIADAALQLTEWSGENNEAAVDEFAGN